MLCIFRNRSNELSSIDMENKSPALTFDIKEDGWETSEGFIMRQIEMPILDEKKNPEDATHVILKINYAGVCGTDRGIFYRAAFRDLIHSSLEKQGQTTRILGHEFLGEVVWQGSMVSHLYNISKGMTVSGDSHVTCGNCYQCKIGENNVCSNEQILGISINGIFAPYIKIPAKNLWPVDVAKVRPEIAAMYDPLGNAVHATTKTDVRGKTVAVFGCGAIGLFSIALLKHFGAAQIIAVDMNEKNLAMAHELGAHQVISLTHSRELVSGYNVDVVAHIMELTGGRGVDVAMEMAGPNSSVNNALESARRGGQVILFGLKDGDFTIPKFSRVITKGLTLHGIIGRHIFETWQTTDSILSDSSNGVQDKIWKVILKEGKGTILPFSDYNNDSFEKAMNEHPKIIFKM